MTLTPDQINVLDIDELRTRIDDALNYAYGYGVIDGSHHKMWVIDQMVRVLLGSKEAYDEWVAAYEGEPNEDGEKEYDWDPGVAP